MSEPEKQRPEIRTAKMNPPLRVAKMNPPLRVAKMNPKVVLWVSLAAATMALMSFSMLFIHAAFRNGWW